VNLQKLGWNGFFEASWNSVARTKESAARVISQHRELWQVAGPLGEGRAEASGKLRLSAEEDGAWPAVGDWVAITGDPATGMVIRDVLPRRTQIARKMAGRRIAPQVLASNVDSIFVLMGLDGDYNPRRLERYIAQGWETGARVVVLLTKTDLCEHASVCAQEIRAIASGVDVLCVSAVTGLGMCGVEPYLLKGQTIVLLGSSGVGKSTLMNRLLSADQQATAPVRESDSRGRHTTTARELFFLPCGAMVIDTPGLRELQLWDAGDGVSQAFGDLEALAQQCRFENCSHNGEPGCAVLAAIQNGDLDAERLENQKKLLREQAFLERKRDKEAQHKATNKNKVLHRAVRDMYRQREKEGKQ
jgi:ribosome biogenesis GTPase / thiamine phosphate phosphatase